MKNYIRTAVLLAAAAIALQGCTHSVRTSAEDDSWQNCPETSEQPCPSKKISGKTAKDIFDALTGAGVEEMQLPDMRTISVHETSCSRTAGKYDCSLKYHKPSADLSPEITIKDGNAAESIYLALAAAGVREDRAGSSPRISVVSIGCMADPAVCFLSKRSYEEIAW